MRFSTLYFRWILLCALWISGGEMKIVHRREHHFAAGLAFNLECNMDSENVSVSWTRVVSQSLENTTGIIIKGNTLWFLPADLKHSGSYSCLSRKDNDTWETIFDVWVKNETCPRWNRKDEVKSTKELSCFLPHIFELDPGAQVTWRNNCQPLNGTNSKVFPVNRSPENVGLFTCFVSFTFEGRNYSSAQTTEIYSLSLNDVVTRPQIVYPKQETLKVTLGESYTLKCKACVGRNGNEDTSLYWFSDTSFDLNYDSNIMKEGDQEYMLSVLYIPEVTAEHLYTNFTCLLLHDTGSDSGRVLLVPAGQSERYYRVAVGLGAVLILLVAVVFFFRVDLVLAYRGLCSRAVACTDGKSYDAYVSFLHGDPLGSSSAMTFALHFLPEVLEDLHGYKLFISSRDELPGEAVHEVVADRMSRSRRLIIVLTAQRSANSPDKLLESESEPSCDQIRAAYEQRVGLYDALVKQGLKVILVQVEDGVEEDLLPESLQYISRSKGVLHWRPNASARANRRFWKYMRYHMPPSHRRKSSEVTVL